MKDLSELFKQLRVPGLTREIFYFLSGFLFLLILNLVVDFNLQNYPNYSYLGGFGTAVAIFTISYFLSRTCKEVGHLVLTLFLNLLRRNKIVNIKKYINNLKSYINKIPVKIGGSIDINHMELDSFIYDSEGINFVVERQVQHAMLVEAFLGFSLLLVILYSPLVLFISVVLLLYSLSCQVNIQSQRVEIAEFFHQVKKKIQNK